MTAKLVVQLADVVRETADRISRYENGLLTTRNRTRPLEWSVAIAMPFDDPSGAGDYPMCVHVVLRDRKGRGTVVDLPWRPLSWPSLDSSGWPEDPGDFAWSQVEGAIRVALLEAGYEPPADSQRGP